MESIHETPQVSTEFDGSPLHSGFKPPDIAQVQAQLENRQEIKKEIEKEEPWVQYIQARPQVVMNTMAQFLMPNRSPKRYHSDEMPNIGDSYDQSGQSGRSLKEQPQSGRSVKELLVAEPLTAELPTGKRKILRGRPPLP